MIKYLNRLSNKGNTKAVSGKFLIWISVFLVFAQCSGLKPGSSGRASKGLYTNFFVGEEGTQYFIKPLGFESENGGEAKLDFTFRYLDTIQGEARINSSLFTTDLIKNIDSVRFENEEIDAVSKSAELMFVERRRKLIESRHEVYLPLAQVKTLFDHPDWAITFYYSGKSQTFASTKKSNKNIRALEHDIFSLF